MELDTLKSAWKGMDTEVKHTDELRLMITENRHPVLKSMRREIIIELIIWPIFLLTYNDAFDGDSKPLYLNVLLITVISLMLIHNILGYTLSKNLIKSSDLKSSLTTYLKRIKKYAIVSAALRVLLFVSLMCLFTSVIKFNTSKYILLGVLVVIGMFQFYLLCRKWAKRVKSLTYTLGAFAEVV